MSFWSFRQWNETSTALTRCASCSSATQVLPPRSACAAHPPVIRSPSCRTSWLPARSAHPQARLSAPYGLINAVVAVTFDALDALLPGMSAP